MEPTATSWPAYLAEENRSGV